MALSLANPPRFRRHASSSTARVAAQATRALHLWHLTSLDAATVAVVWALAFAWTAQLHLDLWVSILLACGTWTVYVGDRLLDAQRAIRSSKVDALRERHYFHWRHRHLLMLIATASGAIATALVVHRMPAAIRNRDSLLAAAALIYFSGVHATARIPAWLRKLVSKELLVGVLFTTGCAAPTLTRIRAADWPLFACLALFVALAWMNCSAIERWESPHQAALLLRTFLLGIAAFVVAVPLAFTDGRASALACSAGVSALLLSLLDRKRIRLSPLTLRTLADLVLLTPLILLALGAHHQ